MNNLGTFLGGAVAQRNTAVQQGFQERALSLQENQMRASEQQAQVQSIRENAANIGESLRQAREQGADVSQSLAAADAQIRESVQFLSQSNPQAARSIATEWEAMRAAIESMPSPQESAALRGELAATESISNRNTMVAAGAPDEWAQGQGDLNQVYDFETGQYSFATDQQILDNPNRYAPASSGPSSEGVTNDFIGEDGMINQEGLTQISRFTASFFEGNIDPATGNFMGLSREDRDGFNTVSTRAVELYETGEVSSIPRAVGIAMQELRTQNDRRSAAQDAAVERAGGNRAARRENRRNAEGLPGASPETAMPLPQNDADVEPNTYYTIMRNGVREVYFMDESRNATRVP